MIKNVLRRKNQRARKKKRGAPGNSSARAASAALGKCTLEEILSQPETWRETRRRALHDRALPEIFGKAAATEPWLFIACGSSYYLSRTIAAQWSSLLPVTCTGVPASEMLFAPEELLQRTRARNAVLISRSGKTTEVLRVARWLAARGGIQTLGVTCNESSELGTSCTHTLTLPWADEKSMVMTRSFTAILLVFQQFAAKLVGNGKLTAALDALPEEAEQWLAANADKILAFGAKRRFKDYVFLGQGAHYWLAQEAALKMTEMSSSYAQAYHTLEFRHGPKAIAGRDTLITFLLSEAGAVEEIPLIGELKKLGAATLVIANRATPDLLRESDAAIELGMDGPEEARLAMTAIPAQLLALAVSRSKGLNADAPRNLTRAVVLDAEDGGAWAKRSGS